MRRKSYARKLRGSSTTFYQLNRGVPRLGKRKRSVSQKKVMKPKKGYTMDCGALLKNDKKQYPVIGNTDNNTFAGHVSMKTRFSKSVPLKEWRRTWMLQRPVQYTFGDVLTTSSNASSAPSGIFTSTTDIGSTASPYCAWNDTTTTFSKLTTVPYGTCTLRAKYANIYADLCLVHLPNYANMAGSWTSGDNRPTNPFGLKDCVADNFLGQGQSLFNAKGDNYTIALGDDNTRIHSYGFLKYKSEYRIMNPMKLPVQVEIYVIRPKRFNINCSPLATWLKGHYNDSGSYRNVESNVGGITSTTGNIALGINACSLNQSLTQNREFNIDWKVCDKKTIVLSSLASATVSSFVPWRHLSEQSLRQTNGEAFKGCTYYTWFRVSTAPGYDDTNNQIVQPRPELCIQRFEEVTTIAQPLSVDHKFDMRNNYAATTDSTNVFTGSWGLDKGDAVDPNT